MDMRYRHALVVGKFAPLHRGHQFLIETAMSEAERVTVLCYSNPDFPAMDNQLRAGWIRALYPGLHVLVPDHPPVNHASDAVHQAYLKSWLQTAGVQVDAVFSSEPYGEPFSKVLGAAHRMVDAARARIAVSGTLGRQDIHAYRAALAPQVYSHFVERVVFLGAESTGKSTLAEQAAAALDTRFVPEIGRTVWEAKRGALSVQDYVDIVRAHRAEEDAMILQANRYLFCDTNALTTLLLGFCYGHLRDAPPELLDAARACKARYRHVFLCEDDFPFQQDGWRDDAAWRSRIQGMVRYDLQVRGIAAVPLPGPIDQRLRMLIAALRAR